MLLDKLFFLAVRQVSKPIAAGVKSAALSSSGVSSVLASVGQGMHRLRIQVTRAAEGKLQLGSISPLSTERAVAAGAELLSELVIYGTAAVTIAIDFRASKLKDEAKKEEARLNEARQWEEFRHLQQRMTLLQEELQAIRREQRSEQDAAAAAAAAATPPKRRGWLFS